MVDISKRFGVVQALDKVSIHIERGEVLGLLGENGAGKTSLMNVLYGLYKPDGGDIFINGEKVNIKSPKDALRHKIAMVHQHFKLIPGFTVLENILLGSVKGLKTNWKEHSAKLTEMSKNFGLEIALNEKVRDLPVGVRQRVEILRALFQGAKLLILDEPTTNLTPHEASQLLSALKRMTKAGLSIVFITHKVKEVMSVADRIVVLRGGKKAGEFDRENVTEEKLIEAMMGRVTDRLIVFHGYEETTKKAGENVFTVEGLKVVGEDGAILVKDVTFSIRNGEILGIAGVAGNGQRELVEALVGVRKIAAGKIKVDGASVEKANPSNLIKMGIAYIPEDRINDGLLPSLSVAENIIIGQHNNPKFRKGIIINWDQIHNVSEKYVKDFKVKTPNVEVPAGTLSGGNIQKILIIRAMIGIPKIILAHNPTRGLDVATADMVLRMLLRWKEEGRAILLISEDLDELMAVCDRIMVMYRGMIVDIVDRGNFDVYRIGRLMTGIRG